MTTPYLSEIRIFSFTFAPKGWAFCDGALLSIQQNAPLFSLIGTYYGGDGVRTFALPDLQARLPLHMGTDNSGNPYTLGQAGGSQTVGLTLSTVPTHGHSALGTSVAADTPVPTGNFLGGTADNTYGALGTTPLQPATIANAGGGQPHDNMQPYLALNFCIALAGIFPSRN